MTGQRRGWARVPAGDEDQLARLAAFRAAHPEVVVEAGEFGTWQGRIPEPDGETVFTRHALRELLDKLDDGGEFPEFPDAS